MGLNVGTGLPPGYRVRSGSGVDRALLVKFMHRTYAETQPCDSYNHLTHTVESLLSPQTPIWWVEVGEPEPVSPWPTSPRNAIAVLWAGRAMDQATGKRNAHIFLLYVDPVHRQQGIATFLLRQVEFWARQHGDRQIGLHVFQGNERALRLYQAIGFRPHSLLMMKPLAPVNESDESEAW